MTLPVSPDSIRYSHECVQSRARGICAASVGDIRRAISREIETRGNPLFKMLSARLLLSSVLLAFATLSSTTPLTVQVEVILDDADVRVGVGDRCN